MYKIMFIDDDTLILRRLYQILNWNQKGFCILPDAADGITALTNISQTEPDIIICDINMPNMDGLTLAEKIKKHFPHIQIIILTVNDSFGCAQQAINIGVDYYLLKPIDPAKLETLLNKICIKLDTTEKQSLYINELHNKAILNEKMIREKFLNWLVSGRQTLTEEQLKERFHFYQIPVDASEFQIISIHINSFESHMVAEQNIDSLIQTAVKTIEDTLSEYSNWVTFSDSFYNLNILIGFPYASTLFNPSTAQLGKIIRENLLFQINLPVTVFYSNRYHGRTSIYRCYYETKFFTHSSENRIEKGVISVREYLEHSDMSLNFDEIRTTTLKYLRGNNMEQLSQHIQTYLSPATSSISSEIFNMLCIDFVMTGVMFLQENRISLQEIFAKHYSPLAEILEQNTCENCILFLQQFFQKILTYSSEQNITSGHQIVTQCEELIKQNIGSPELSVKWISKQLYISDSHLSRIFKQQMNLPLVKYITIKRMELAKHYLDNGGHNLQQIALAVGFTDPLYFSKCFKKQYGIAPSKYRFDN